MEYGIKKMDHAEYPKRMKGKSEAELRFILVDARQAADAFPDGVNVGYYLDEINYAGMELTSRLDDDEMDSAYLRSGGQ